MKAVRRLLTLGAVATVMAGCGVGTTTVQQAAGLQASASGTSRIDPAKFAVLPFETLRKMHREPNGDLRKEWVGKRVQVNCLAEYLTPTDEYTGIKILLYSATDRKESIQPIDVTPGLFYFQSREKKEAWLKERGFLKRVYDTKQELPPVTLFGQVLPSAKDRNETWPKVLDYLAVRRADGKFFGL